MPAVLRDYQRTLAAQCIERLGRGSSALLVAATGTGKTIVAAEVIRHGLESGQWSRVLWCAHREELLDQAAASIAMNVGCAVGIEQADRRVDSDLFSRPPVVVASMQTLVSRSGRDTRLSRLDPASIGLVVIDEAHRGICSSYRRIVQGVRDLSPGVAVLGLTATPDRGDKIALGHMFGEVAGTFDILDGVNQGWLVPLRSRIIECGALDLTSVGTVAGDLNRHQLAAIVEQERVVHQMVGPLWEICGPRRCLVFACSVAQAQQIAAVLCRYRAGCAECVSGKTPRDERKEIFRRFAVGELQYLVNCMVATEGWDDPASDGSGVQVVAIARPTKSRGLYAQMVGRITRPLPGTVDGVPTCEARKAAIAASRKTNGLIVDFVGNSGRHKLVSPIDILAGSALPLDVRAASTAVTRTNSGGEVDIILDLEAAVAEAERRRAADAAAKARVIFRSPWKSRDIDPFGQPFHMTNQFSRSLIMKTRTASAKQIGILTRHGAWRDDMTAWDASVAIDKLMRAPPSSRQAWVLSQAGYNPADFTHSTAMGMIDRIRAVHQQRSENESEVQGGVP